MVSVCLVVQADTVNRGFACLNSLRKRNGIGSGHAAGDEEEYQGKK